MAANFKMTIETFPTLFVPQAGHEVKIYDIHGKLTQQSGKRISAKNLFSNSLQKRGVIHSSLALSKRSSVSTSDLLTVKSYASSPMNIKPKLPWKDKSKYDKSKKAWNKQIQNKHPKPDLQGKNESTSEELYRISFPCPSGCANCAFSACLGPVKVFISQFSQPKRPYMKEISDGWGRVVFPRSRRKEIRGLVYDKQTHSLHPPLPRRRHGNAHLAKNKITL